MKHQKVPPYLQMIYLGGKDTLIQTLSASSVRVQEFFLNKIASSCQSEWNFGSFNPKSVSSDQFGAAAAICQSRYSVQASTTFSAAVSRCQSYKTFFYFFTDILYK